MLCVTMRWLCRWTTIGKHTIFFHWCSYKIAMIVGWNVTTMKSLFCRYPLSLPKIVSLRLLFMRTQHLRSAATDICDSEELLFNRRPFGEGQTQDAFRRQTAVEGTFDIATQPQAHHLYLMVHRNASKSVNSSGPKLGQNLSYILWTNRSRKYHQISITVGSQLGPWSRTKTNVKFVEGLLFGFFAMGYGTTPAPYGKE